MMIIFAFKKRQLKEKTQDANFSLIIIIAIYLFFQERRPRTMVLHLSLNWASVEASLKDEKFFLLSSSRNSLLKVVFGLPGFLFPVKGSQVKA